MRRNRKNKMKDKFYIVYMEYSEYNQFEGSWDLRVDRFKTHLAASKAREALLKSNDVKDVTPILIAVT
jgi:hypothetical protein